MPVRIEKIQVRNLGPIRQFRMDLGSINLIYGRNEEGKTALVEFLVHSLFRHVKPWNLRFQNGDGKVRVSGLAPEPIDFSPSNPVKLDDYWAQDCKGLPPDFGRLLVVKGAETRLSEQVPINRTDLQKFLSNRNILDRIEGRISKTIRKCSVEKGHIAGPDQGENKDRKTVLMRYEELEALFSQLDKEYSGGRRRKLSDRKQHLVSEIQEINDAKRHLAWKKDVEIKRLGKTLGRVEEERLRGCRSNIHLYWKSIEGVEEKTLRLEDIKKRTQHFKWLRQAESEYRDLLEKRSSAGRTLFVMLGGMLLVLAIALLYFNLLIPAGISLFAGVFLLIWFLSSDLKKNRTALESLELSRIKETFKKRFQMPMNTLSDIQSVVSELEKPFAQSDLLTEELERERGRIEELSHEISQTLFDFTGKKIQSEKWDDHVSELQEHIDSLRSTIHTEQIDLERLNVDPPDYLQTPSERMYEKDADRALNEQLQATVEELNDDERRLETLKQRICVFTGDDISISWEALIQKLKEVRMDVLNSVHARTADILGKMAVSSVLDELRHDEEEKIEEGLRSPGVLEPLNLITGRYTDLKLEENGVIVSDGFHDFELSRLSTGAMEQVLLALRIGFARRWMDRENESFFLVLDDAFQYSDWKRRESLMKMVVSLAKNDWQVIYFSMDDHIRSLFRKVAKPFGDEFRDVTLSVEEP